MKRSLVIRLGIAASVLAHVLLVAAIFLSTNVHPYTVAEPDFIPVDIVDSDAPKDAPKDVPTPVPTPTPTPDFNFNMSQTSKSSASGSAPSQQQAQSQPKPQPSAKPEATAKPQQQPSPQQQPQPQSQPQPQAQPQSQASAATPQPTPSYAQPEPDLTVKYGVMLGLPSALPPPSNSDSGKTDDKEAGPTATTNLAGNLVAALRDHLKSCSKLPPSISPADNVSVKLRVRMNPDGTVAAEPELIQVDAPASAAAKVIELKQSALNALSACQPYKMLPADRYREWRILELSFTPQNFSG